MINFILGLVLGAIFAPILIKVFKIVYAKVKELLNKE